MATVPESEYEELKRFLAFYSTRYMAVEGLPPEVRPIACLERLETKSRRMAREGLRQAINDTIEATWRLSSSRLSEIDDELKRRRLVTLSELRRRFSRQYARIVNRRVIKDETEYYLIRGVADGISPDNPERELLAMMISEFEAKIAR